jgi:hypothetical protein
MKHLGAMRDCLRRFVRLGVLGACLVVPVGAGLFPTTARAQSGADGPQRTFVRVPDVKLPVEIEEAQRAQLKSLVLYMKESTQGSWIKVDQGLPHLTEFIFRAPHEGEYWFRVVAIDNQGRTQPADLNKDIRDAVVVVFDATPPAIDLAYGGVSNEGTTVRCEVRDANLDPLKTQFFFQTQNQAWQPLDAVPGRPGLYCIPRQAMLTNRVKATAVDLAGNPTTRVVNLGELATGQIGRGSENHLPQIAAVPAQAIPPAPTPYGTAPSTPIASPPPPSVMTSTGPIAQPIAQLHGTPNTLPPSVAPQFAPPQITVPTITTPQTSPHPNGGVTIVPTTGSDLRPWTAGAVARPVRDTLRPNTNDPSVATVSGTLSRQPHAPNQIVNNTNVFVNYAVENVGASGVGKIEIWVTSDQCRTWTKVVEERAGKNPAEIRLPGEGVFGVKMVATNGRGFGAQAPQSGDPADTWIEIDTTKPKAEIVAVQCGAGAEAGVLTVFWRAEDKNLAHDGIELLHAATREGPWTPIAKGLHNDKGIEGQYRWTPPAQAGAQTFLRLVVRDRAGNVAISQTVQPVPLDDLSRPRIRVLNVSTVAQPTIAPPATLNVPTGFEPGMVNPVQATTVPSGQMPQISGANLGMVESR